MTKLKIALFCDGIPGAEYLETILPMEQFQIIGYHGNLSNTSQENTQTPFYADCETMIERSEIVLIIMPPAQQFEFSKMTLKNQKHLFIEKPLNYNIEQTETLLSMQREANVKIQVGSGIRANKEFIELSKKALKPLYLETRNFSSEMADPEVSVVLNTMLEDLDIILSLVKSDVQKINAIGVCVDNETPDIVNARLEFGNGCVASLTAGRSSKMDMHTTSLFLKDHSITLDFLDVLYPDQAHNPHRLTVQHQANENRMALNMLKGTQGIQTELLSFYQCILKNTIPTSSLNDGYKALKLANQIMERIEERGCNTN